MNQILAGRMAPVHRPPLGIVIKLIEEMIDSLVINQPVGIIGPTVLDRIMILTAIKLIVVYLICLPTMDIEPVSQTDFLPIRIRHSTGHSQIVCPHCQRDILQITIDPTCSIGHAYLGSRIFRYDSQVYSLSIMLDILDSDRSSKLTFLFHFPNRRSHPYILQLGIRLRSDFFIKGILKKQLAIPVK